MLAEPNLGVHSWRWRTSLPRSSTTSTSVCERAVRCAWAMQRTMAAFNAESRALGLPELTMGIGLHAGRVVAGNIGSSDRVKYGVVGPPVNLAARIESLTVGPQVLLSREMLACVEPIVRVGPPHTEALKGMTPLGYVGTVDDVAAAAVYFASDEARYVTGQVLGIDGGIVMGS